MIYSIKQTNINVSSILLFCQLIQSVLINSTVLYVIILYLFKDELTTPWRWISDEFDGWSFEKVPTTNLWKEIKKNDFSDKIYTQVSSDFNMTDKRFVVLKKIEEYNFSIMLSSEMCCILGNNYSSCNVKLSSSTSGYWKKNFSKYKFFGYNLTCLTPNAVITIKPQTY